MKGEGKNRKNAECAYAIACSTHKTKHAKKERRTKRKKNRPVSAKSRQETTKRPPLFFQSPHDFFNAYTLRTPRRTKPAQKGGAYSEKWGNAPLRHSHIERKSNHRNKKKTKALAYPEFLFYFCRNPPEKHPTSRDFTPTSHPHVPLPPLAPHIGSAILRGLYLQPLYLVMKTLFLLLLTALGFTACTRRIVEHVEVHDTLRLSDTDTVKQAITLTDSVFIHDSTFIENGIPVRSRLIFHRQLIDHDTQHRHRSAQTRAHRQEAQRSALRAAPFPFPAEGKRWWWLAIGAAVGLGVGRVVWKK